VQWCCFVGCNYSGAQDLQLYAGAPYCWFYLTGECVVCSIVTGLFLRRGTCGFLFPLSLTVEYPYLRICCQRTQCVFDRHRIKSRVVNSESGVKVALFLSLIVCLLSTTTSSTTKNVHNLVQLPTPTWWLIR
jgi:hypothetical protein